MSKDKKVTNLGVGKITPQNIGIEFPFQDMEYVVVVGIDKEGSMYRGSSEMPLSIMTMLSSYLQAMVTAEFFDSGEE